MEILNKAGPKDKVFDFDVNQICAFTGNRPVRLYIPKKGDPTMASGFEKCFA